MSLLLLLQNPPPLEPPPDVPTSTGVGGPMFQPRVTATNRIDRDDDVVVLLCP